MVPRKLTSLFVSCGKQYFGRFFSRPCRVLGVIHGACNMDATGNHQRCQRGLNCQPDVDRASRPLIVLHLLRNILRGLWCDVSVGPEFRVSPTFQRPNRTCLVICTQSLLRAPLFVIEREDTFSSNVWDVVMNDVVIVFRSMDTNKFDQFFCPLFQTQWA